MVLYQSLKSASTSGGTSMRPIWSAGAMSLRSISGVFQLVARGVLRPALHRFVAGPAEKAGHGQPLGQVLLVVPAVELFLLVGRDVRPHHQERRALALGHWIGRNG